MENYGIISVEMFMILAAWKVEEVEECSRYIYIYIFVELIIVEIKYELRFIRTYI